MKRIIKITRTPLEGVAYFKGYQLNNDGWIVGLDITDNPKEAFVYKNIKNVRANINFLKNCSPYYSYYFEDVLYDNEVADYVRYFELPLKKNKIS